jgi:pyruvate formate lyase activating enzyme
MVFDNLCTGCGKCMEVCPNAAVHNKGEAYTTDLKRCTACGLCTQECPSKARHVSGRAMTAEQILEVIRKDDLFYAQSDGGVTFCGGEPTCAGDFLVQLAERCQKEGYHTGLDTCGYCSPKYFKDILNNVNLVLFDLKHMDPSEHARLTGQDNAVILDNLNMALGTNNGLEVRVRVPLMPGQNDSPDNIAAVARFLHDRGRDEVDILPCHKIGWSKYTALQRGTPLLVPYEHDDLQHVLDEFTRNGLHYTLVE